jgi:predicted lipoprotein with Yx(FWY)xxD motif
MTVSVSDTSSGDVLTTSDGKTLYFSDQERNKVLCDSGACQAIWTPLTVSSGDQPSAPGTVGSELTTLKRSDGSEQVALDGRPLYTFSFDHSAGDVNGDGQKDSFDGIDFTWHAATPIGKAPAAPSGGSTTQSPYDNGSNTGGNGGYNY